MDVRVIQPGEHHPAAEVGRVPRGRRKWCQLVVGADGEHPPLLDGDRLRVRLACRERHDLGVAQD
jgi:hypothetical protein